MIEQTARVLATDGDQAEVEIERRSTCGACGAQGACGVSLLDQVLGRRPQRLRVDNVLAARVGDRVVVGVLEGALLRAALAAYLLPLLGLLGGAIVGQSASPGADLGPLLGGAAGFGAGLWWLRGYGRRLARDPAWRAVLLRRAGGDGVAVGFDAQRVDPR